MTGAAGSENARWLDHPAPETLDLSSVLFALSDRVRLDLVRLLAAHGPQTASQCRAVDPGTAASTFSHHLKLLREAGIISSVPEGRHRRVSLRRAVLDQRFPGLLESVGAA